MYRIESFVSVKCQLVSISEVAPKVTVGSQWKEMLKDMNCQILPLKSRLRLNDTTSIGHLMLIKQKALIYSVLSLLELGSLYHMKAAMASSKPTSSTQVPQAHNFELIEGMQLQVLISTCAQES